MTYELKHVSTGESLHRAYEYGWDILQDPYGGGHFDSRCMGGWWLFKGDEAQAREEQRRMWTTWTTNYKSHGRARCGQCGQSFFFCPHDPQILFLFCVGIPCAWICGQCGQCGRPF